MFTASSISLPLEGWTPVPGRDCTWTNAAGDLLSAHYFALPPDLPAPLTGLTRLRAYYRGMLGPGGGIVEVERVDLSACAALRTIVKIKQQPTGMAYVASITVPFATCSFVAKVQCPERGMTGIRDAVVGDKLGLVGRPEWFGDPYDPSYRSPILRNRSDDAEWDAMFPNHPLSRARAQLGKLMQLRLPRGVEDLAPFSGGM